MERIQKCINTILKNSCYSLKEETAQLNKIDKYGIQSAREQQIVKRLWSARRKLAEETMAKAEALLEEIENEN